MKNFSIEIFADCYFIYLSDGENNDDISSYISDESLRDRLVYTPSKIGIVTARNMDVSLEIEIIDREPSTSLDSWDHAFECSIVINCGRLAIYGPADYRPDAMEISVEPGVYKTRILHRRLDTLSEDGLDGEDSYKVLLWLTNKLEKPKVLKQAIE